MDTIKNIFEFLNKLIIINLYIIISIIFKK